MPAYVQLAGQRRGMAVARALRMKRVRLMLVAAATLAAGCAATTLVPAPDAKRLAAHAAFAEARGVRIAARAEAWNGMPQGLTDEVTPLLVTIINESDRAIRVSHEGLVLVGANGRHYRALAPIGIEGVVIEAVPEPPYPPLASRGIWPHPAYWNSLGPLLRYVRLPTLDMLRQALPEAVVQPGGQLSGFVYFERIPPDKGRVALRAQFREAGGERVTRVEIPFQAS